MELNLKAPAGIFLITGYGKEGIRFGEKVLPTPLLVLPQAVYQLGDVPNFENWQTLEAYKPMLHDLDLVLLGTGPAIQFLPEKQRLAFKEFFGVPLEVMDTKSACRTYSVLAAEGRRVGAILL